MSLLNIQELLRKKTEDYAKKEKYAPHQISATVDLIVESGIVKEPKYGYKYWLGKVKRAEVSYNDMIGILKEINGMSDKYNKGGRLTNLLTDIAKKNKKVI